MRAAVHGPLRMPGQKKSSGGPPHAIGVFFWAGEGRSSWEDGAKMRLAAAASFAPLRAYERGGGSVLVRRPVVRLHAGPGLSGWRGARTRAQARARARPRCARTLWLRGRAIWTLGRR
eukprot:scaffold25917_cov121-Isochrysis_galbana.AAC.8